MSRGLQLVNIQGGRLLFTLGTMTFEFELLFCQVSDIHITRSCVYHILQEEQ